MAPPPLNANSIAIDASNTAETSVLDAPESTGSPEAAVPTPSDRSTRRSRRRNTAHLKDVPETKALRTQIRRQCAAAANRLNRGLPPTKDEMEVIARGLLNEMELSEGFLGWTMVMLASEFWRDQVAAVPPSRRLFLLPHCLKHAEGCPADYDEYGLDCERCGACSIADFRTHAEKMGYKVLVAEGSPIVLKIIVSGHVDAIVGVACLNVLEKAIDKILLAGIPCAAVPLLSSDCRNTSVDEDWVTEMINLAPGDPVEATRSYVHLMRAAKKMFEPSELQRLAPRLRSDVSLPTTDGDETAAVDPVAATEAIAYDFLAKGGKHSRPFTTLSVFDALTGAKATSSDGAAHVASFPDAVKRAAISIETFHKASLVHDDIEDDDQHRYGEPAVHRRYGIPTAINVGDYMIGLGYRLVSRDSATLGSDVVADILDNLADAHMRLSEGQGAELIWRDARDKRLKPIDALKIYALKTAPAFEAALLSGARLAGRTDDYKKPLKLFARNVGVAFQILNDLKDWQEDRDNKLSIGGDILGGRPTLLWAMALEALDPAEQTELLGLVSDPLNESSRDRTVLDSARVARVRQLYRKANVFEKAERLVDKHQERAEAVADDVQPDQLRRLLYYLVDTVLDRGASTGPVPTLVDLPISAGHRASSV